MNEDYWYIGQKVSDQRYGDGIIISTTAPLPYIIGVDFETSQTRHYYTEEGKSTSYDPFSCLSPYPHVPIKYNKIFKKGDLVKYKFEGIWYIGIYDRFIENKHLVLEGFNDENLENVFDSQYIEDENILKY